jgi:hypothetical protein
MVKNVIKLVEDSFISLFIIILLNSNHREHYESIMWTIISHTQQKIPNIVLAITKDAEYLLFYSKQNL